MNSLRNLFSQPFQLPAFIANPMRWFGQLRQFASNPVAAIMSMKGINVPQNFNGSPEELGKYLIESGQMPQDQFQQFAQIANQTQNIFPKF